MTTLTDFEDAVTALRTYKAQNPFDCSDKKAVPKLLEIIRLQQLAHDAEVALMKSTIIGTKILDIDAINARINPTVLGDGFGKSILGIMTGRITNGLGNDGTDDFLSCNQNLGTNADVWVHIPIKSAVTAEFTIYDSPVNSIGAERKIQVGISNTHLSFKLQSIDYRSVRIDVFIKGLNPNFTKSDLGSPYISLNQTP